MSADGLNWLITALFEYDVHRWASTQSEQESRSYCRMTRGFSLPMPPRIGKFSCTLPLGFLLFPDSLSCFVRDTDASCSHLSAVNADADFDRRWRRRPRGPCGVACVSRGSALIRRFKKAENRVQHRSTRTNSFLLCVGPLPFSAFSSLHSFSCLVS